MHFQSLFLSDHLATRRNSFYEPRLGVTDKVELVHCSEETEDDGANALLPKTSHFPQSMEGEDRLNLNGKSTPFEYW